MLIYNKNTIDYNYNINFVKEKAACFKNNFCIYD